VYAECDELHKLNPRAAMTAAFLVIRQRNPHPPAVEIEEKGAKSPRSREQ